MRLIHLRVQITSLLLVLTGATLMAVSISSGGKINIALPLVFLVLGGGFFMLLFRIQARYSWASFLYIPAFLFSALGIIFLLNVVTGDWKSWAYAWLLPISATGIGLLFTNREKIWHPVLPIIGWCLALAGAALFGVFGVIAGGLVIQIVAPVLLIGAGVALYWLRLQPVAPTATAVVFANGQPSRPLNEPVQPGELLAEPLSTRELEVLRLIQAGYTNQQIADQLSVAPSTVKTHINNIYGKLGVQTRVQAINRARELGLFTP
jgi:DNA-binding CsgD family transcriptional regulator